MPLLKNKIKIAELMELSGRKFFKQNIVSTFKLYQF